jgi:tRNA 2-thiouridine synthesizing protein A
MATINITKESDARGSFCPGPLMELIRLVRAAKVGDVLAVLSRDEGSKKDIPAWIAKAKHEFISAEPFEDATRFICRKRH